jgi:CheY-like chemotaxis protein
VNQALLPAFEPLRILVVDDNSDAAQSLAQVLNLGGEDVHVAFNGKAAVSEAQAFRPHVIILDIGMPGMNGYDACKAIRCFDWARKTIVVALTGWNSAKDRELSKAAGFDFHFAKPIEPSQLAQLNNAARLTRPS